MRKGLTFTLVVLLTFFSVPLAQASAEEENSHLQEEIIYYLFVDRFNNGDYERDEAVDVEDPKAYHGGDIQGITLRLNELLEIGVSTLVLSPIMKNAPDGYHGFWVDDFYEIDEQFGSMEDFHELVEEAHEREMKVVLELPINYMSETAEVNDDWVTEPALTEEGPDWMENAVQLDQSLPEVQEELLQVADFWMEETDIDGFQLHGVDQASPEFLTLLSEHIKEKDPNFYLIGNIFLNDMDTGELLETTEIDAVSNESLYEALRDVFAEVDRPVSDLYDAWENSEKEQGIIYADDIYSKRFTHVFAENGRNPLTVWKMALTFMYTTPGTPAILQGSEYAMYGVSPEDTQRLVDFHAGEPELKEFHDRLANLKEQFPALSHGDFELVDSSESMSVFKRTYEDQIMYIAINNSSTSQDIVLSDLEPGLQLRGYLADNIFRENEEGDYRIGIPRESVEVFAVEEDQGLNWGLIGFAGSVLLLFVIAVIYLSVKDKKREANKES